MWTSRVILAVAISSWLACSAAAEMVIVEEGQPRAQIVIAPEPARMVKLAAKELQTHIQLISGAKLPIVTEPKGAAIYIGRSKHTDRLGINDEGLHDGAFRIKSGDSWLVLLGHDSDYVPTEPWARNHGDYPRMMKAWDELTGTTWGNPVGGSLHKRYSKKLGIWAFDERGSLNAVYELLRSLGVRWYMPGELGRILPRLKTITVTAQDKTIRPEFGVRYQHTSFFGMNSEEDILWYLRLGLNHHSKAVGHPLAHSHGMRYVISRKETAEAHPEYYAIWGGKRMTEKGGKPCLSSHGLLEENVRYIQTLFKVYDLPMASLFPPDGYGAMCQCNLCAGKGTPQRGWAGSMSDYVWGYVNRAAQEIYKTHPDKKISCFAYGSYLLPPENIDKLSPNLVVGIVQPRRLFNDESKRAEFVTLRKQWLEKSADSKLFIWDHYPFTLPGRPAHGIPQYFPHLIAEDLRSLSGISYGELLEVMFDPQRNMGVHAPAFNHLNVYVTARMYWNTSQDIDAFLESYYKDFYGPAAEQMKTFVNYCQANTAKISKDTETINQVLLLINKAKEQAPENSDYRKRIDLLIDYLQPLYSLREQLAIGRDNAPKARARVFKSDMGDIQIDGKLNEPHWQKTSGYALRELQTGRELTFATSFKACWMGDAIYFAIYCADIDATHINIGTRRNEDANLWQGDVVELLIETQTHAYYQIAIGPTGATFDLDRVSGLNRDWDAKAQVATQINDDGWTVEVRIPIADEAGGQLDPRHYVVGRKPTEVYPWYFNVCRQRIGKNGSELSAFSPTGRKNFHDTRKFGKLIAR